MAKDKRKTDIAEKKSTKIVLWIIAVAAVVIAGLVISGKISIPGSGKETGKSFNLTEKETRPVLDPALFTGQVRAAYAAAQKYPDLLNEVYCYCFCNEPPFNHKTLLSCFTEDHGAG